MCPRSIAELLRQKVTGYVARRALMRPGDRVGVAVSGGADSTALLRLLLELRDELGLVLSVVHFHHKLRGKDADADEGFVRDLAQRYGLSFHAGRGDVREYARKRHLSLETAARELRYGYFRQLLFAGTLDKIATAHTRDDQAETVLLRVLRGAGTRGMAGIYPRLQVGATAGVIVRPLLEVSRGEIEQYLRLLGQGWREDLSNVDVKHTRNRVRHVLLPVLEKEFNPGIRQLLANSADIARAEEEFWAVTVAQLRSSVVIAGRSEESAPGTQVRIDLDRLLELPLALQRRLLIALADEVAVHLDFEHVEAVLAMGKATREALIELPGNWVTERRLLRREGGAVVRAELVFRQVQTNDIRDYEYVLPVPGEVRVDEVGLRLRSRVIPLDASRREYNPNQLLSPAFVGRGLVVRNWRSGDRFWPAHFKSTRKVKELLQTRHISGRERTLWPVAVNSAGELVWVRGFAVGARFAVREQDECAILISAEGVSSS